MCVSAAKPRPAARGRIPPSPPETKTPANAGVVVSGAEERECLRTLREGFEGFRDARQRRETAARGTWANPSLRQKQRRRKCGRRRLWRRGASLGLAGGIRRVCRCAISAGKQRPAARGESLPLRQKQKTPANAGVVVLWRREAKSLRTSREGFEGFAEARQRRQTAARGTWANPSLSEAADRFAAGELGQVLLLPGRLVGECVDRHRRERRLHAHHRAITQVDALDFERDQAIADVIKARAAVSFGDSRAQQADLAKSSRRGEQRRRPRPTARRL